MNPPLYAPLWLWGVKLCGEKYQHKRSSGKMLIWDKLATFCCCFAIYIPACYMMSTGFERVYPADLNQVSATDKKQKFWWRKWKMKKKMQNRQTATTLMTNRFLGPIFCFKNPSIQCVAFVYAWVDCVLDSFSSKRGFIF